MAVPKKLVGMSFVLAIPTKIIGIYWLYYLYPGLVKMQAYDQMHEPTILLSYGLVNYSIPKTFMGTAISTTYVKIDYDISTGFPKALWEWLSDSRSQKAYGNGIL